MYSGPPATGAGISHAFLDSRQHSQHSEREIRMAPIKGDDGTSGIPVPAPGTFGVLGDAKSSYGVVGTSGGPAGVYGESNLAEVSQETQIQNAGRGVLGVNNQSGGIGVEGLGKGVYGVGVQGTGSSRGVYGASERGAGVSGVGYFGVFGNSPNNIGVYGLSTKTGATGVRGESTEGTGVFGQGVIGVKASNLLTPLCDVYLATIVAAGDFRGHVFVSGILFKAGGGFLIDHPLDPANKYLHHSFVESPDRKNVYDGIAVLDGQGEAVVELPAWFSVLNRDFRYQLTCLGGYAPVFVAEEIEGNRFRIGGGSPGFKVSWLVTGIRQDPWANANLIQPEHEKPEAERGSFSQPDLYGQPEEKSVQRARYPQSPAPPA